MFLSSLYIVQANFMDLNLVTKVPDGAFYPSLGRKWPTIALEVGYAESYEDLVRDATLLMEGSKGKIGLVIIVKLQPLEADETEIQKGFVEVWAYNYERKNCFKLGQQVSELFIFQERFEY